MRYMLVALGIALLACSNLEGLKKACEEGKPAACEEACGKGELGDSGCLGAAEAYAAGEGVPRNAKRASAFIQKACEGKLAEGCIAMGKLAESEEEKLRYFDLACEYGEEDACDATLVARVQLVSGQQQYKEVPKILAVVKNGCDPGLSCPPYEKWLETCANSMFFNNGLSGLDCPDHEPECAAKKKAAVRPYCTGEKQIPKMYLE